MKKLAAIYFLLILCSCSIPTDSEKEPLAPSPKDSITYLALGDSYTIGESVENSLRWPVQLAVKLNEASIKTETPKIIARTGWTTNELSQAIESNQVTDTFDLVSLLIGVNNQYRGYPFEQYEIEFRALLETALGFAGLVH